MPNYIVKTSHGRFNVTVNEDIKLDFETRERRSIGKMITVGGRHKCVGIKAPYASDTAHLLNTTECQIEDLLDLKFGTRGSTINIPSVLDGINKTVGGCELDDNKISGEKTVGMLNLAFTFLKREMPNIKRIELEDKSDFPCTRSDGSIVGISLALYEMMFHQQSWYERHFGAYLVNPSLRELYTKQKENFNKPPEFDIDFHNKDLNESLPPILRDSKTWKEFFAKVYTMQNKCEIIFSWYSEVLLQKIFSGISFDRQSWIIDLDKTHSIEFISIEEQKGGKYFTRKNTKKSQYYKSRSHFLYNELYAFPISI